MNEEDPYDFGGDTIGIGYSPKNGLCIVTFNGIVKNSLDFSTTTELNVNMYLNPMDDNKNTAEKVFGFLSKKSVPYLCRWFFYLLQWVEGFLVFLWYFLIWLFGI